MIKLSLESLQERRTSKFHTDCLFRITTGSTPFKDGGSWSAQNVGVEERDPSVYVTPVLYTWIKHYFESDNDRIFVLERPKDLTADTMCCGLNSHYHFCYTKHPELLAKMTTAVLTKKFNDPELKKMFAEHEARVLKKFGKKLSELKGGLYLATLGEYDATHPKDAYPEIIINPKRLEKCKWEELIYLGGVKFKGKKTGKIFSIEQPLPKYGKRYRAD